MIFLYTSTRLFSVKNLFFNFFSRLNILLKAKNSFTILCIYTVRFEVNALSCFLLITCILILVISNFYFKCIRILFTISVLDFKY